jgi:hypothetical protein
MPGRAWTWAAPKQSKSAKTKAVRGVLADQVLLDNSRRADEMFWLELAAIASTCLLARAALLRRRAPTAELWAFRRRMTHGVAA